MEATFPAINASVYPNIPFKISINFYNPVKLSNGKLSIYQVIANQQYSIENNGNGKYF